VFHLGGARRKDLTVGKGYGRRRGGLTVMVHFSHFLRGQLYHCFRTALAGMLFMPGMLMVRNYFPPDIRLFQFERNS